MPCPGVCHFTARPLPVAFPFLQFAIAHPRTALAARCAPARRNPHGAVRRRRPRAAADDRVPAARRWAVSVAADESWQAARAGKAAAARALHLHGHRIRAPRLRRAAANARRVCRLDGRLPRPWLRHGGQCGWPGARRGRRAGYARRQDWGDASRIVVAGQSYGGLAALSLATQAFAALGAAGLLPSLPAAAISAPCPAWPKRAAPPTGFFSASCNRARLPSRPAAPGAGPRRAKARSCGRSILASKAAARPVICMWSMTAWYGRRAGNRGVRTIRVRENRGGRIYYRK